MTALNEQTTIENKNGDQNDEYPIEGILSHRKTLKELKPKPRRNRILHWGAFILSLVSLGFLIAWLVSGRGQVPISWFIADIVLGAIFIGEFFSRSGFRWNPVGYTITRFFDFIAIVPVLALVNNGFPGEAAWVWLIFVARLARSIDRALGDGFVRRNAFALVEGFEEEITDRVLLRIMERIQSDLDRGQFGRGIAEVLEHNKPAVLQRIGEEHPFEGVGSGLVHLIGMGLDTFLRRTEGHVYEAAVNVMNSPEMDRTIRDTMNSIFERMRKEIAKKTWRQHLGLGRETHSMQTPEES